MDSSASFLSSPPPPTSTQPHTTTTTASSITSSNAVASPLSPRRNKRRKTSATENGTESEYISDLRTRLQDLLNKSLKRDGRFAFTSLGEFANKEFEMGIDHISQYSTDRAALVEYIIAKAKKREVLTDYTPCAWAHLFEGSEAGPGYIAAQKHMDLRKKFNYSCTIGTTLPEALAVLWTACYCWGELATIIAPGSVAEFSGACFPVFSLLGDRLYLVPLMKVSSLIVFNLHLYAVCLTHLLLLSQPLVDSLEHRTQAFENPVHKQEIKTFGVKGYIDYRCTGVSAKEGKDEWSLRYAASAGVEKHVTRWHGRKEASRAVADRENVV